MRWRIEDAPERAAFREQFRGWLREVLPDGWLDAVDNGDDDPHQALRRASGGNSPSNRRAIAARQTAELQTDALREQLAVVGRVTEQQLGGLGPLEVQVGGVLPGEADAAVDLDVLHGRGHVRP